MNLSKMAALSRLRSKAAKEAWKTMRARYETTKAEKKALHERRCAAARKAWKTILARRAKSK